MPRYRLTVEFDGTNYAGWQRQDNDSSIQEEIEKAIFAFSGETQTVFGAGRTDSGVHALEMTAHFDCAKVLDDFHMCQALNSHLRPQPISILHAQIVSDGFHARFDAKARSYIYKILNRRARPALDDKRVWWVAPELDIDAMRDAAAVFLGKHDFTTFRATQCQAKSPVKTLDVLDIGKEGDVILLHFKAPSFLHHQVRNLTGALRLVGDGSWDRQKVIDALNARDRKAGGPTAPAEGLYFERAYY